MARQQKHNFSNVEKPCNLFLVKCASLKQSAGMVWKQKLDILQSVVF